MIFNIFSKTADDVHRNQSIRYRSLSDILERQYLELKKQNRKLDDSVRRIKIYAKE